VQSPRLSLKQRAEPRSGEEFALAESAMIVLDGGMGRELHRIGAPFRQPEWSALALMEAPETVRRVHESFIAAGARVITANSYAIVPFHIGAATFAARGRELADLAGRLAREAADAAPGVEVAGSLPPLFGSYRPDLFRDDEADALLAPLVKGLSPHVNLWLAETLSSIAEAKAARRAIGADARPFWLSFTLDDSDPEGVAEGGVAPKLRSGETIAEAAAAARALQAAALLFNCSDVEVMEAALTEASRAFVGAPAPRLGVYANAFEPHRHSRKPNANAALNAMKEDLGPADYLGFARRWRRVGATIVGGCCGIGPDYVAALAAEWA
jgi:S-methylmethionine-dependent homocysteine/selenocysteine methylase